MNPNEVAVALRAFADKLDRSEKPSRSAVAAELRKLLAAVDLPVSSPPATKK